MANINKIRLSGTSYDIEDKNAAKTVTLTQAEYDALTVKDPNTFYVISDSEYNFDGYWTSAETQSAITEATSGKLSTSDFNTYSGSVNTALNLKASQTDLNTLSGTVTSHTADTTIHVSAEQIAAWNAKSDFSGSYNDLTNKLSAGTNISIVDNVISAEGGGGGTVSSAITSGDTNAVAGGAVYDRFDEVEQVTAQALNVLNDRLDEDEEVTAAALNNLNEALSGKQDVSGMTAYTTTATTSALNNVVTAHTADTSIHVSAEQIAAWNAKSDFSGSYNDLTNKLSAGTNISIVDNVISAEGGGKAIEAGRGISVATGATADTISVSLPISAGTGLNSVKEGFSGNSAAGNFSHVEGYSTHAGENGYVGHAEGYCTYAMARFTHAEGYRTITNNECEHASGQYNVSSSASTTFGDSGNTLFSVGNGTSTSARHNAFEIRQNGDIYLSSGGTDIKLQDHLGGGGSSYTAGDGIDITSNVISVTGKVDTSTYNTYTAATDNRLSEDEEVTAAALNTLNEALSGKQDTLSAGTNITIVDNVISAEGGGSTYTAGDGINITNDVISVTGKTNQSDFTAHTASTVHMTTTEKTNLDSLATNIAAISGITSTKVGNWDTASTNSHTHSNKTVLDGINSTKVSNWDGAATNASNAVTALGGLSLVKLTQQQYDSLSTKDNSTLYVIVG